MIEVVGQRADQTQKIDRRTYRVRENAQSAGADGIQLLRGLPAVTIGVDDQLMLLGNPNVTILVDEHPIQGDQAQFLRTIHGSDIERIEIITNPSAQFPSVGTGGIVNIVLKKKRKDGLTASANGEVSSLGRVLGGVTVKYKKDKWTIDGTVEGNSGRWSKSTYRKYREVLTEPGGVPTVNTEEGGGSLYSSYGGVSGNVTYDLDPQTQVGGGFFFGGYGSRNTNDARFEGLTADFPSFEEEDRRHNSGNYRGLQANFDHRGKRPGETLKGYAFLYRSRWRSEAEISGVPVGDFSTRQERSGSYAYAQADWTHPIGKTRILSVGGQYQRSDGMRRYRFETEEGGPVLGSDTVDKFDPLTSYYALYSTYQMKFGSWTFMPGLRVERMDRDFSSAGREKLKRSQTDLFPTLHIDHPLSEALNLSLSYSKRIDRADPDTLAPYPIVTGFQSINIGNPALRDQSTDAFEANLHFHRKKLDIGLIVYDRETSRLWGSTYSVNSAGMNVISTINTGHQSDRGAQLDISTPLLRRVKANASINLFDSRVPSFFDGARGSDEIFRYSGNATIEWNGPSKEGRPGDIGQIQLTYDSPQRAYQIRYQDRYSVNLSYTHSLTKTFAITGTLEGLGQSRSRHRLEAPLVREDYWDRRSAPVFKLKLVKTFGGSQPPQPSSGPPPMGGG